MVKYDGSAAFGGTMMVKNTKQGVFCTDGFFLSKGCKGIGSVYENGLFGELIRFGDA
jgi:hypothetical protein